MKKLYGYMRVSTDKQVVDRQRAGIEEYVAKNDLMVDEWFIDVISGANLSKPEWNRLKSSVEKFDTIIVLDFDRLGRDWEDIKKQYYFLVNEKINLIVVNYDLLNIVADDLEKSLEAKLVKNMSIELACYVAQKEREKISQRTKEALAVKKQQGVILGRRSVLTEEETLLFFYYYINSNYPISVLANLFSIKHGTARAMISKKGLNNDNRTEKPLFVYDLSAQIEPEKLLENEIDVNFRLDF